MGVIAPGAGGQAEVDSEVAAARRSAAPNSITHRCHRLDDVVLANVFNKCNHDGLFDATISHPRLLSCMRLVYFFIVFGYFVWIITNEI